LYWLGVEIVRTHRKVVDVPSEELAVEILGGVLVGGANPIPQKAPGGYLSTFGMGGSIPRSTATEKFEDLSLSARSHSMKVV
jgi:hypothetical protein